MGEEFTEGDFRLSSLAGAYTRLGPHGRPKSFYMDKHWLSI